MNIIWVQAGGVLLTFLAASLAAWNARSSTRAQTDVQHRTVSLSEMEKALEFTGEQLQDLRSMVTEQRGQIRTLEQQHLDCERDNLRLSREIADLRRNGGIS